MFKLTSMLIALVPAALAAQVGATTSAKVQVKSDGDVAKRPAAAATVDAELAAARAKHVEAARASLVNAGRAQPSNEEVESAASAIGHGYVAANIEAIAKAAPADRSLAVAFEVLTKLAEQGVPSAQAISQVQAKIQAGEDDAAITALAAAAAPGAAKKP